MSNTKSSEAVIECTFAIKVELGNPFSKPKDRLSNAKKILQQFLDEQLAERDKRIEELEQALIMLNNRGGLGLDIHTWIKKILNIPEAPHV